jgi:hypothetical protein
MRYIRWIDLGAVRACGITRRRLGFEAEPGQCHVLAELDGRYLFASLLITLLSCVLGFIHAFVRASTSAAGHNPWLWDGAPRTRIQGRRSPTARAQRRRPRSPARPLEV